MNNSDANKKKLILALVFFILLLLLMCFTSMMSTYNDSVDPEDYDTDPPAIFEEDFNNNVNPNRTEGTYKDWKSFEGKNFSFLYPPDWNLEVDETAGHDTGFDENIILKPNDGFYFYIKLRGDYPFGFGQIETRVEEFRVKIMGKTYLANELYLQNADTQEFNRVIVDLSHDDFKLSQYTGSDATANNIMFFFANNSTEDHPYDLNDYIFNEPFVVNILESFELKN